MQSNVRALVHTPADLASEHLAWATKIQDDPGIQFGIAAIDKLVIPMRGGDLISIISRPGHGKTSLMAYLAKREATRIIARNATESEAVVYITWEQSAEELECFFQADGQYSASDIAWGRVDLETIKYKAIKRATVPIWVIGHGIARADQKTPRMTPSVVLGAIETMQADFGVRPTLMIFDYIQLIPTDRAKDRVQQVTEMPIKIKELALRVGAPAIAGVQAARAVDERKEKIPEIRDAQWACLAGDVELLNAHTGEIATAQEIWLNQGSFPVHCLRKNDLKIGRGYIEQARRNEPEMIFRLTCGGAGNIRATIKHKFYTPGGWVNLENLRMGDWIALAKHMPIRDQDGDLNIDRAYILGLLLGDGTLTRSAVLSNSDWRILHSYKEAVEKEWPGLTVRFRKQTEWDVWDATIKRSDDRVFPGCNEALNWLKEIGVFGQTAKTKHVPSLMMGQAEVSALLSGLFTTDGGVSFRHDRPMITFASCSRQLVNDVQTLLCRLGIFSTQRIQKGGRGRKPLHCLRVAITDLFLFNNKVNIYGKKGDRLRQYIDTHPTSFGRSMGDLLPPAWNSEAITILKHHHLRSKFNNVKGRSITRGRMAQIAEATGNHKLQIYADCDLFWHKITDIEQEGIEYTYDFLAPTHNNFVANRFVVHNSSIEQTSDKVFGLWRPWQTEEPDSIVELGNDRYDVNEWLLILRLLKQRGDRGRHTWAMYFQPQYMKLALLETRQDNMAF